MPTPLLPSAAVPLMFNPMKLPSTAFLFAAERKTPSPLFPEIRLPCPLTVPPIVLFWQPNKAIPPSELGRANVPVGSVPMRFPWIRLSVAPAVVSMIPAPPSFPTPLSEMVFPLMMFPEVPRSVMPESPLPRPAAPMVFVPMKLLEIEFPPAAMKIPSLTLPAITLFAIVLDVLARRRPAPPDPDPGTPLPSGVLPAGFVPILFPWTRLPPLERSIPSPVLPEITLPAPAVTPPMVLFVAAF